MIKIYLAGGFFAKIEDMHWQDYVKAYCADMTHMEFFNPRDFYNPSDKDFDWFMNDIDNIHDSDLVFGYVDKGNPTGHGLAFEAGYAMANSTPLILVNEQEDRRWAMIEKSATFVTKDIYHGLNYLCTLSTQFKICPNCLGELREITDKEDWKDYHYSCRRCGRGWEVLENGDWKERFAAGNRIYPLSSVLRAQLWGEK